MPQVQQGKFAETGFPAEREGWRAPPRSVRLGDELLVPGSGRASVFEVVTGCCFLYLPLADGGRQILHFALPGDVVDADPLDPGFSNYGFQALEHSVVKVTAKAQLHRIEDRDPAAALRLWRKVSLTRHLALDRLCCLAGETAAERIAHLSIEFCVRAVGDWPVPPGRAVRLPFRQEQIADATALTREHVSRTAVRFGRMGVLGYRDGSLTVLEPDRLLRLAGLDEGAVSMWLNRRVDRHEPAELHRNAQGFSRGTVNDGALARP